MKNKGIYYLLNDDKIVYIGKSLSNMKTRVDSHLKDEVKEFDSVIYHSIDNDSDINILEVAMIAKHSPIYNNDCVTSDNSTIDNLNIEDFTLEKTVITDLEKKKPRKIPNFYMIGITVTNKHGLKGIDLIDEVINSSKAAQYTIKWIKDAITYGNRNGVVKIEMKELNNVQQQQFQKGFKELNEKNLMRRVKRSHYMINPNALIPSEYDEAMDIWSSLEK